MLMTGLFVGGGFRFDLKKLYLYTLVHWIKKLAGKDIKCTLLLANYRNVLFVNSRLTLTAAQSIGHGPEHRFPAAMEDISAIHLWLVKDMGVPIRKLIWGKDNKMTFDDRNPFH